MFFIEYFVKVVLLFVGSVLVGYYFFRLNFYVFGIRGLFIYEFYSGFIEYYRVWRKVYMIIL